MGRTKIEWVDESWNPVTGCPTKASEGCRNCYAEALIEKMRERRDRRYNRPFTTITIHDDRLEKPLRWMHERSVFVCSLGDLFHPDVPFGVQAKVLDVAKVAAERGSQMFLLTKHAEQLRGVVASWQLENDVEAISPNMWFGVTGETQRRLSERVRALRDVHTSLFLCCEPLLEYVDVSEALEVVKWVIVGGESGQNARPMKESWVAAIIDDCAAAEIPCFVKQLGTRWERAHWRAQDKWVPVTAKGAHPEMWPEDLRVRQLPEVHRPEQQELL
jgi:protein gp37